ARLGILAEHAPASVRRAVSSSSSRSARRAAPERRATGRLEGLAENHVQCLAKQRPPASRRRGLVDRQDGQCGQSQSCESQSRAQGRRTRAVKQTRMSKPPLTFSTLLAALLALCTALAAPRTLRLQAD